jgi:hypothetical protein
VDHHREAGESRRGTRRSPSRPSTLAGLRLVAFWALWPCVVGYFLLFSPFNAFDRLGGPPPHACSPGGQISHALPIGPLVVALAFPLAGVALEIATALRIKRQGARIKAWASGVSGVCLNLLNLLILSIFLVSILGLTKTKDLSMQARAGGQARLAVEQALLYSVDRNAYPTELKLLREERNVGLPDRDPWGRNYVLAAVLTSGAAPGVGDDVFVYSRGPCGVGRYTSERAGIGRLGAIGYSSLYGAFSGEDD